MDTVSETQKWVLVCVLLVGLCGSFTGVWVYLALAYELHAGYLVTYTSNWPGFWATFINLILTSQLCYELWPGRLEEKVRLATHPAHRKAWHWYLILMGCMSIAVGTCFVGYNEDNGGVWAFLWVFWVLGLMYEFHKEEKLIQLLERPNNSIEPISPVSLLSVNSVDAGESIVGFRDNLEEQQEHDEDVLLTLLDEEDMKANSTKRTIPPLYLIIFFRGVLGFVAFFFAFFLTFGAISQAAEIDKYQPIGELVPVQVNALHFNYSRDAWHSPSQPFDPSVKSSFKSTLVHVHCTGERASVNQPTLVLESGTGQPGIAMLSLLQRFSNRTDDGWTARTCLYDRAGYGWSQAGVVPRNKLQHALEMEEALRVAGESGPYVAVGAGEGGQILREFARIFPEKLSGLVLVDSFPGMKLEFERAGRDEKQFKKTQKSLLSKSDTQRAVSPLGFMRWVADKQDFFPQPWAPAFNAHIRSSNKRWNSVYTDHQTMLDECYPKPVEDEEESQDVDMDNACFRDLLDADGQPLPEDALRVPVLFLMTSAFNSDSVAQQLAQDQLKLTSAQGDLTRVDVCETCLWDELWNPVTSPVGEVDPYSTWAYSNVQDFVDAIRVPMGPFFVGGSVAGLNDNGNGVDDCVRVAEREQGATNTVVRCPGDSAFVFPTPFSPYSTFNVVVERHPAGKQCEVIGGQGEVVDADVSSVLVVCHDGTATQAAALEQEDVPKSRQAVYHSIYAI